MSELEAFLAGDRLDSVAIYIGDQYLGDDHALADAGTTVDEGVVLVVDGEKGRSAFEQATGLDPMQFSKQAMERDGEIDPGLAGGGCPDAGSDGAAADADTDDHRTEFIFAFAEAQNEEVGGLYAEGDVVHAYAHCACGTNYSQKWLVGSRE
ncbi:hypothetical protein EGH24_04400 [Halonotius terrestris]|uniref:Uncharacterized protein n=1 Tax=Halonotius terrestris TaxID=2487750 RepID=A0A8J8TBT2_9EURY|nr:DUF5807 family protein [Halonotius terrestris]TQQ82695.1 hypothetical protein EGH24_04400 [Halonotius terrestris]